MEQDRLESAGESASVERRLRRSKIIPLAHSSNRANVVVHSSDRTHVNVRVYKCDTRSVDWSFASATALKAKSNTVAVKAFSGPASCFYAIGNRGNVLLSRAARHIGVMLSG